MKKFLYKVALVMFILLPFNVIAEGYITPSTSSLTIEQGSSKNFTLTAYNSIGDVYIKSNNDSVATVGIGEWTTGMVDEKQTKTENITVKGNNIGTAIITLSIDAATFDGEDLAGQTKTITVNVIPKPAQQSTNQNNNNSQNNLSTNNNIKSLVIDGYELIKVNNNNYTLTVSNDISSIKVNAIAEDSKAKVTGIGAHELKVGENNIEVIVISEAGTQNKINIKITRKDGYYLEDLDLVLKSDKIEDSIIINNDSKITTEQINKIKDSKKTIKLNYYDENKKLIYSWSIDGKKIKHTKEVSTTITYSSKNKKEIYKLSNYADGININFEHNGELLTGTKIKLYVGDKFENNDLVNLYSYKEDKLNLIENGLEVTKGYIEFDVSNDLEYFATLSNISDVTESKSSSINIFLIISIIEFLVIIVISILYICKGKTNRETLMDYLNNQPRKENNDSIY